MQDTITKIEDLLEDLEGFRDSSVSIIDSAQLEDIMYELADIKEIIEKSSEMD